MSPKGLSDTGVLIPWLQLQEEVVCAMIYFWLAYNVLLARVMEKHTNPKQVSIWLESWTRVFKFDDEFKGSKQ